MSMAFTIAAAMSSGWTGFCGPVALVPAINSVLVNVGMTTVTSTPWGANSSAMAVVRPTTANLVPA